MRFGTPYSIKCSNSEQHLFVILMCFDMRFQSFSSHSFLYNSMQFFIRWIFRRQRLFYVFLILFSLILILFIYDHFSANPSNLDFLQIDRCPYCFGADLCPLFAAQRFHFTGWKTFTLFNNEYFNVKNIFWGTFNDEDNRIHRVIFKKLAHQSEWNDFDHCRTSTNRSSCPLTSSLRTLLPCSIDSSSTLAQHFRDLFLASTRLNNAQSQIAFQTSLQINLEPIVLRGLSHVDYRFPTYFGACGRVIVVSDEGTNLVEYLRSSFGFRAFLARELLITMHQLNTADSQLIIYYPDINLENFVFNQREKRIKIIDLENVIIVEREIFNETNDRSNQLPSQWCHRYRIDFNIEQVCRFILLPASASTTEMNMESSDLLHHVPNDLDNRWNLNSLLFRCAQTNSTNERLTLYKELLNVLANISQDNNE